MQLVVDFLPVLIFFVAYKIYGMYVATAAIMVAMSIQVSVQWIRKRSVNKMLLASTVLVLSSFWGAAISAIRQSSSG
jgi:intracellular septation protein